MGGIAPSYRQRGEADVGLGVVGGVSWKWDIMGWELVKGEPGSGISFVMYMNRIINNSKKKHYEETIEKKKTSWDNKFHFL